MRAGPAESYGTAPGSRNGENDVPDDVPPPPDPPDDPAPQPDKRVIEAAQSWLEAANLWRKGNEHFEQRHYASAVGSYEASQQAALRYFEDITMNYNWAAPSPLSVIQ